MSATHPQYVHGHRAGKRSPTYNSWRAMIYRCTYTRHPYYPDYGGRGITVCERWRKFVNFLADMGERPPGMTLERIEVDGHYEPGNVRWADVYAQRWNRRDMADRTEMRLYGDESDYVPAKREPMPF